MLLAQLFLHEMAHGVAALMANPECLSFAIEDAEQVARCYAQQACIAAEDQLSEIMAGPLFDLLASGRLESTAPPELVKDELFRWALDALQRDGRMQTDQFRLLSIGGMLEPPARHSALRAGWLAACSVHTAYETHGAQIAGLADCCAAVTPNALAFERQNVMGWLKNGERLIPTEVHLPFWLDTTGQNEAVEIEVRAMMAAAARGGYV